MERSLNVLICVTRQISCERLIRTGYDVSRKSGGRPHVIHVAPIGENFLGNPREGEALDYLFDISKQVGAEMTVLRSNEVIEVLTDFTQKHKIGTMVLGESANPQCGREGEIIKQLKKKLRNVEFIVVPA
ncbi:MAG TPA: universal stress protein UspA [Clostridia bacterium]|nr:universal stress protein UspA [Clostridia bacterium]